MIKKKTVASVRKRTIPTERPPSEVSDGPEINKSLVTDKLRECQILGMVGTKSLETFGFLSFKKWKDENMQG
jgi:hypothetical protein